MPDCQARNKKEGLAPLLNGRTCSTVFAHFLQRSGTGLDASNKALVECDVFQVRIAALGGCVSIGDAHILDEADLDFVGHGMFPFAHLMMLM